MKARWKMYIFALLVLTYLCYSFLLYSSANYIGNGLNDFPNAQRGQLVWQKYNCQSCHQLYGLGGYLGPDLSNIIDAKGKTKTYILGIIQSGTKQMPSFVLDESEKEDIYQFLNSVNASGVADPRSCVSHSNGMITKHDK